MTKPMSSPRNFSKLWSLQDEKVKKRNVAQIDVNNFFAVQNLKMALKKANILQHTKSFFV